MSLKSTVEEIFLPTTEKISNATGLPVIFDIAQIMNKLYGYKTGSIVGLPETANIESFNIPQKITRKRTDKGSPIYGMQDMIGREVFLPLTIETGGVDYEFPFVVVSLKSKALLVETPMIERSASVIEEIGLDAWRMTVKGFLVDPLNQFPDDQLEKLKNMWKTRDLVRVKCALTDIFLEGNDNVVISSIDIPAKAKVVGVRDFSFELIQDGILDLYAVK